MLDDFSSINILDIFNVSIDINKLSKQKSLLDKEFLLPSLEKYSNEENFTKIYLAYSEEGLFFNVILTPPTKVLKKEDFIEFFIDTRDLKTKGYITKFCHHFIIYPEIEDFKEITKFRVDDMHILCDPRDVFVKTEKVKEGEFLVSINISKNALYGFDINEMEKLGFTTRVRCSYYYEHYNTFSEEFSVHKNPYLWASLILKK